MVLLILALSRDRGEGGTKNMRASVNKSTVTVPSGATGLVSAQNHRSATEETGGLDVT